MAKGGQEKYKFNIANYMTKIDKELTAKYP